jgi:hypothetical protein
MSDIGAELTNSLDRTGRGGMLAPFRIFDGTISQPGLGFNNEVGLGIWRSGTGVMQFVAAGVNLFRIDSGLGAAVSPTKLAVYGEEQFRVPGSKWWRVSDIGGNLRFMPSATADAEDWDAAKGLIFDTAGGLTIAGGMAVGTNVSITGNLTLGPNANLNTGPTGVLTVSGCSGSFNVASAPAKLSINNAGAAGDASYMCFSRIGQFYTYFGLDIDNQLKFGGGSFGTSVQNILHTGNSFTLVAGYHLDASTRNINSTGSFTAGSVMGAYQYKGAFNSSWDFRIAQTIGVTPGSTITSILLLGGQVGRILVNGGGSINLPAGVKLASGTAWGTTYSIVSMWGGGGTDIWATVTPYSVP